MNKSERRFIEVFQRFIKPYSQDKVCTLKWLVFYLNWAIWPILHIYFIQQVVIAVENKDEEWFFRMMIIYWWALCGYYVYGFLVRKWYGL